MTPQELYTELQSPEYDSYPFSRDRNMGDNMEIVSEVIGSYWRERFLINHTDHTAYQLMDSTLTLQFVTEADVDWEGVKTLDNNECAYSYSARFQRFAVFRFADGVAMVMWTLYPDGRYFMDEDGYGMEDNEASIIYGYIDTHANVVVPFQACSWEHIETLRPQAVSRAKELAAK